MKIFLLLALFAIKSVIVLANAEGECVDLWNHYDVPFKLWNKTRGVGLKLGNGKKTGCCTDYTITVTTIEAEALEVVYKTSKHLVLTSDPATQMYWPWYRSGVAMFLKTDNGALYSWNSVKTAIRSNG